MEAGSNIMRGEVHRKEWLYIRCNGGKMLNIVDLNQDTWLLNIAHLQRCGNAAKSSSIVTCSESMCTIDNLAFLVCCLLSAVIIMNVFTMGKTASNYSFYRMKITELSAIIVMCVSRHVEDSFHNDPVCRLWIRNHLNHRMNLALEALPCSVKSCLLLLFIEAFCRKGIVFEMLLSKQFCVLLMFHG